MTKILVIVKRKKIYYLHPHVILEVVYDDRKFYFKEKYFCKVSMFAMSS